MRLFGDYRIITFIVVTAACFVGWSFLMTEDPPADAIRKAYVSGDYEEVRNLARGLDLPEGTQPEVWLLAGQACRHVSEYEEAISYFQKSVVDAGTSPVAVDATLQVAAIQEELGRYSDAVVTVTDRVGRDPDDAELRRLAARLMGLVGRRYEANIHHLALVKAGRHTVDDLVFLANRNEPFAPPEVEEALRDPHTTLFRVTRAMFFWQSGKLVEAAALLREEIANAPESLGAHSLLGRVLVDQGRMESLAQWHAELPSSSDGHPDVWYVRGVWAEHLNRTVAAAQCFEKALRLDDCFPEAMFRLAAVVDDSLAADIASLITVRISSIEQYREICKAIFFKGPERQLVSEAVELADSLGHLHEAAAWCRMLNKGLDATAAVQDRLRELETQIAMRGDRNSPRHWNLLDELQLRDRELPSWPLPRSSDDAVESPTLAAHFEEVAHDRGLNFKYENGAIEQSGLMIQQSMGGGVAVLDFDRDAWPDVFFPQGRAHAGTVRDALFRNLSGESFTRIDEVAQCGSDDYSHGASVGDVDDDGFPDLYVANSGRNRLYLNNGDGTFSSVDDQFASEKWSISCAIADVDGDSFPDLFDVNYLEWGRPFTEQCTDTELGLSRTCPPDRFKGERNDLHLNSGDGDFRNVTEEVGLGMLMGKGLGVVVADFEDSGKVGVFVANDEVPNTYLTRSSLQNDQSVEAVRFVNQAGSAGVAFDGTGAALACMGVATSDVNHDGHLDMFVTNFYRQPNTLYLSVGQGGFQDATRSSGLAESGLLKLGFGTQFLDANLDGEPDLVVGNGHLDDFTQKGIPFAMQPQLYLNTGAGRFEESAAETTGRYFEDEHIARGMATLDWNRDGLTDFAVSHLGEPVSLLSNDTATHGHFVTLRLIGIQSGRDALGTRVAVTAGGTTRWRHMTAGDGYASSNEKKLTFGLASDDVATGVRIKWPNGEVQEYPDVRADRFYVAVQSRKQLIELPQ